jgi:hypothetical protein
LLAVVLLMFGMADPKSWGFYEGIKSFKKGMADDEEAAKSLSCRR